MADTRPPTENQLSKDLPGVTVYVTGHTPDGKAVLHSKRPVVWGNHDSLQLGMAVAWTTSFPSVSFLFTSSHPTLPSFPTSNRL
jgi:hypothetical protein